MTHCDTSLLLVARRGMGAMRACQAAEDYLSYQWARLPLDPEEPGRRVIGVWLDESMVDVAPDVLDCASMASDGRIRIVESSGIDGMWTLYSLDAEVRTIADIRTIRERLITVLITVVPRRPRQAPPQFSPVFDPAVDRLDGIRLQTRRLNRLFLDLIGEPLAWNSTTGSLTLASELDPHDRRR